MFSAGSICEMGLITVFGTFGRFRGRTLIWRSGMWMRSVWKAVERGMGDWKGVSCRHAVGMCRFLPFAAEDGNPWAVASARRLNGSAVVY